MIESTIYPAIHGYIWGAAAWMMLCIVRQLGAEVHPVLRIIAGLSGGWTWAVAAGPAISGWDMQASPPTILLGGALLTVLSIAVYLLKDGGDCGSFSRHVASETPNTRADRAAIADNQTRNR